MERLAGFLDGSVPAEASLPLPDPRPTGALLRATRGSDASDAARPDAVADGHLPVLEVSPCVERLAVPELVFPELAGEVLLEPVPALCKPDAVRSVA